MGDERPFELRGVNHVALVCRDMARTVAFYRDTLGLPLVKTIDLPMGLGPSDVTHLPAGATAEPV
jgi:catechol 2,3-dioxygenase-like lactoylglutathione lyase family enzyme